MLSKYFKPSLLKTIAEKAGTPVYVYSQAVFLKQIASYKKAFRALDPLFCYAMKANSSKALCALAAREGWGADVVSGGELYRALKAGFEPGKIIFSGVGKTPAELEDALKAGILFINAESFEEVKELERVAARLKLRAPLSLRINPDVDPHTHKFITTGKLGSKFGVSFEEAQEIYLYAAESKHLNPVGAQFHIGSQVHSAGPYAIAAVRLAAFILKLASRGVNLKYADVGGGWGVKEGAEMSDPAPLARAVADVFAGTGLKVILEPGRSVAAPAGALLTRVIYRKRGGHKNFIIVDGHERPDTARALRGEAPGGAGRPRARPGEGLRYRGPGLRKRGLPGGRRAPARAGQRAAPGHLFGGGLRFFHELAVQLAPARRRGADNRPFLLEAGTPT